MKTKTKKPVKSEPFEKSLERLETTVRHLESGEKGLEESLELFESGVRLAKELTSKLEDVKHRVSVVTKAGGEQLKLRPMTEDEEG